MRCPWNEKWVCIDACLATEIGWLWLKGVKTIESCCGHGKDEGYIAVQADSIPKMKELGYKGLEGKDEHFYVPQAHSLLFAQ